MIYQLAQQMLRRRPRLFAHGEQKRDYIYTEDVVRANMLAAAARNSCVVNCGSGTATTFNDLVAILNEIFGTSWEPEYIENPYAAAYQSHTECEMTFAKEALGFFPRVDIHSGLKAYFDSGRLVSAPP
jgi:ADP-L-glycero-D-manno-heptose 6-epimerase